MAKLRVIAVHFELNNGPVDRRDVHETESTVEAFTLWGKLAAQTNGGVCIVDQHNCVLAEFRAGWQVNNASPEQRQFYAL